MLCMWPQRISLATQRGFAILLLLFSMSCAAQQPSPRLEPQETVAFDSRDASVLDLIKAITQQTCAPIGIIPGRTPEALSSSHHSFHLENVPVREALNEAVRDTVYRVVSKDDVFMLIAEDATAQQLDLLGHRFDQFGGQCGVQLPMLAANLSSWMGTVVEPVSGYAGSILGSLSDERLTLSEMHDASVEEIANRIVTLGSKGMWRADIPAEGHLNFGSVGIRFTSYQHYPCAKATPLTSTAGSSHDR